MTCLRRLLICAVFAAGFGTSVTAADLPSHEATYDIRLTRASNTTGPRAISGTMETRFAETCDGWETKTHVVLDLAFRDGSNFTNERRFTSWEAKSGNSYRFAVQTIKNGRIVESFKGTAKINARGGEATYEPLGAQGKSVIIRLPKDTLLPAAHAQALMRSAAQGQILFRSVVMNGASSSGPRIVSTAIGPRLSDMDVQQPNVDKALSTTPSWRMSSAIFNLQEQRDTPNSETSLLMHQGAVMGSFEQTFSDFAVAARLSKLKKIDPPVCR